MFVCSSSRSGKKTFPDASRANEISVRTTGSVARTVRKKIDRRASHRVRFLQAEDGARGGISEEDERAALSPPPLLLLLDKEWSGGESREENGPALLQLPSPPEGGEGRVRGGARTDGGERSRSNFVCSTRVSSGGEGESWLYRGSRRSSLLLLLRRQATLPGKKDIGWDGRGRRRKDQKVSGAAMRGKEGAQGMGFAVSIGKSYCNSVGWKQSARVH